jgi:adenylate kinase
MKAICVTGSVGTGKTTLAKKLAKKLKYNYIDVHHLVVKDKLHESYDEKRKCYVVDTDILNEHLIELIKESKRKLIIDSHLSHYLPKKYVDLCIVLTTDLKILTERLKKRKYSKEKILNNVQTEIFQLCSVEAKFKNHNTLTIDTTRGYNLKKIIKFVKNETAGTSSK